MFDKIQLIFLKLNKNPNHKLDLPGKKKKKREREGIQMNEIRNEKGDAIQI